MNFFKKLGRTATDIWASTVYKVGSVRKISKINATLAKEESNIDALYLEIGKAYFDAHSTDADCEFTEKIFAIKEAQQKIEDSEKQKQAYLLRQVGQTLRIVPEREVNGVIEGYAENYVRVYAKGKLQKCITQVRVERLYKDGVWATVLE